MNYNNQCIIVYSLRWTETNAIAGLCTLVSPDIHIATCFSAEELVELLSIHTTAPVILGILPHESVLLLSRLGYYLRQRQILFFGQTFNYADRAIPLYFLITNISFHEWKNKTIPQTQEALSDFISTKNTDTDIQHNKPIPPVFSHTNELIHHINVYLYQGLSSHGVGLQSGIILVMLSCGLSTDNIAKLLNICNKTVSVYKYKGLSVLGMGTGAYNIYRGILVRSTLQQYR
ncbi:hypothetical protein [Citrobacter cronae]|uniref:hypothetical protein n=1 Tax=Citrobacter cronae TaxID=1748967 RepID=UPI001C111FD2|nr:hypothetical protein [Citrobacter cronae]MBU5388663.1 hypothetical protein [Citrobacter cronae]